MRRLPGRYVVYGMLAFAVLFLGSMLAVALRLGDAADRFHEEKPPAAPR